MIFFFFFFFFFFVDGLSRFCELLGDPQCVSFSISHEISSIPDGLHDKFLNLLVLTNVLVLPKFPAGLSCGEKGPGSSVGHLPQSSAEAEEIVELYL